MPSIQHHLHQIDQPEPLLKMIIENNSIQKLWKHRPFLWGMTYRLTIQGVVLSMTYIRLRQAFKNRPTFCNVDLASSREETSKT